MNRAMRNEEMLPGDRMEEIIKEKVMVGPGGMRCCYGLVIGDQRNKNP